MLEGNVIVYKFIQDLHFFVTGGEDENELILATVLQGFFDAVGLLLRLLHYVIIYFLIEIQIWLVLNNFWTFILNISLFQRQCGQEGGS